MLVINNHDQEKLLSMADSIESGYRQLASGDASVRREIVYKNRR